MRWKPGRVQTWRRPEDGGFDSRRYEVAVIGERPARTYVEDRHYSGTWVAARLRYGLMDVSEREARLAGVGVLSVPVNKRSLLKVFPDLTPYTESLDLGRLVLDDEVPSNAETWLLARMFKLARAAGIRGVVSYSDPVPRACADGTLLTPGHVGTTYQAENAVYTGRGTKRSIVLLPDGSVLSARAMQKIRKREQGHEYAEQLLISRGAREMRTGEDPARWLAEVISDIGARRIRHQGCHRYGFPFGRRARPAIALTARPYPKIPDLDALGAAA
jgi:hypothetical protein